MGSKNKEKVIIVEHRSAYRSDQSGEESSRTDNKKPQPDPCENTTAENNGLLNDLVVDQCPPVSTEPRLKKSNKFAELTVNVDHPKSRVLLDGTVVWKPEGISLLESIIGIINAGIIFGIPAVLRVWKDDENGCKVIGESRDTSQLLSTIGDLLNTAPTDEINFVDFAFVTTPFHAVDTDPASGKNHYFLTIDLDTSVIPGSFLTNIIGLSSAPPQLTTDDVRHYSFSALEIGESPKEKC